MLEVLVFLFLSWFVVPTVVTMASVVVLQVVAVIVEARQARADRWEYELHRMGEPMYRIRLDMIAAYPNSSQGKAYRIWNLEHVRKRTRIRDGEQREA